MNYSLLNVLFLSDLLEYKMERTAISLFMDGKTSELTKFMKGIKTDEVIAV